MLPRKFTTKLSSKRNKVRTNLLIIANSEITLYLKNCTVLINTELPSVQARNTKVYDGINIDDFVKVNSHNTQKDINK